jgi:uncharacterized protein (DUF3084 family)
MESKIDIIKENVKESFSLVKSDVDRINNAFDRVREDMNEFEDKIRSSFEGVDIRQTLLEKNFPKMMESHGKSLQSILRLNKSVIALNTRLSAIGAQDRFLANELKKVHRELHRMKKSIYKRLDAQEKDIKKRALKPKKRKK